MPMTEKNLRVLIVDDYRDGADALGMLVEELGHHVQVAYSGRQALAAATAFPVDLVLADLAMPDVDGCTLVKCFRQIAFAQAKVVAITGQKSEDREASAIEAGFDRVLFKPIPLQTLKAVLASLVVVQSDR